jgi:hypothetical protein
VRTRPSVLGLIAALAAALAAGCDGPRSRLPARGDDGANPPAVEPWESCPPGGLGAREGPRTYEDDPVIPVRKRAWEEARGGEEAAKPHIRARLAGWPERLLIDGATLPRDDRAFLERVARDTWRGLAALTDREHGLPVDHVRLADPDTHVGDYTNVTNVGLHLVAAVAAHELGLVPRPEAVAHVGRMLDTLDGLERHRGFLFNYYDTTSLERTSNFLSFLDSAWLTAGLMVVRATFPELHARCSDWIDRTDYGFFYDAARRQMHHGYFVHRRAFSRYHYGVLYTEARLAALIAIGKGDVSPDVWLDMVRTYSAECAAQSRPPRGWRRTRVGGRELWTGYYEWRGARYVPSWGGSMFEALMPALVVDERRHAPQSLGANNRVHAVVQRRYALEELGYPVWGLSPSATPHRPGYEEYGVRVLGALGYPAGAVTPHAAALALLATPDAALANLRRIAERYDAYGDFGFYDALDPLSGEVARTYLTLDQAMVLIAAANHLTGGAIQKRFASDPIARRALPVIGAERFFD